MWDDMMTSFCALTILVWAKFRKHCFSDYGGETGGYL
jgi:hypothetical protein